MDKVDWKSKRTGMTLLRRRAHELRHMLSSFEFLKVIGLVPEGVTSLPVRKVKLDGDPEQVEVGYLAASAYEWDSWGPCSPADFVRALSMEMKGATSRDLISQTLTALGRAMAEEAA